MPSLNDGFSSLIMRMHVCSDNGILEMNNRTEPVNKGENLEKREGLKWERKWVNASVSKCYIIKWHSLG